MDIEIVTSDIEPQLDWLKITEAIEAGHQQKKAILSDHFMYRGKDTFLSRTAWIDGLGIAVKDVSIFPENPLKNKPSINGSMFLYNDLTGELKTLVDFHLITKWKTAADSLLAARKLARSKSKTILIIGAGNVGYSMYEAYSSLFSPVNFLIWNRTLQKAKDFSLKTGAIVVEHLEEAVACADIITSATMSMAPLIKGRWLKPGQHIDLIGSFRPDTREVDDDAITRCRLFVDHRENVTRHIGELKIPLSQGIINPSDIKADFYDIQKGLFTRRSKEDITLFKNGGGAHLDLMVAQAIREAWRKHRGG